MIPETPNTSKNHGFVSKPGVLQGGTMILHRKPWFGMDSHSKPSKTMEIHGVPCSKNLGKTNKNRMEIMEIQEMLKFKFMYFLEK